MKSATTRSEREMWSENSLYASKADHDSSETSSEIPSLVFEELLPMVCRKYGCEILVYVAKDFIKDNQPRTKKPDAFPKSRKKSAAPLPTGSNDTQFTYFIQPDSMVDTIVINALYNHNNKLQEVNFNKIKKMPCIVMKALTLVAPNYDQLVKISIRNSRVTGFMLNELNRILLIMVLTDICLDDSRIVSGEISVLLEQTTNLKHLSLARCQLSDEVCEQIASKLDFESPSEKKIAVLNLSCNRISDEGAKAIGQMLRMNRHLRCLNMSGNFITDDGANYIFSILMEFPLTLEELQARRLRVLGTLKKRRELVAAYVAELELNSAFSLGVSNLSVNKLPSKKAAFGELTKNTIEKPSNKDGEPAMILARAQILAEKILANIPDPFYRSNIVTRNGWQHCIGNFSLCYINMSYNHLTYLSLKQVYNVMYYQKTLKKRASMQPGVTDKRVDLHGVIKIIVEGNLLPESTEEYKNINVLTNKCLSQLHESTSKTKSRAKNITIASP